MNSTAVLPFDHKALKDQNPDLESRPMGTGNTSGPVGRPCVLQMRIEL